MVVQPPPDLYQHVNVVIGVRKQGQQILSKDTGNRILTSIYIRNNIPALLDCQGSQAAVRQTALQEIGGTATGTMNKQRSGVPGSDLELIW
jgi:hypothetical protein